MQTSMQTSMQGFLSPAKSLPMSPPTPGPTDARTSVNHLLSRAHALPCSKGALAFNQLVQPTARFQLALDALLPILDSTTPAELASRILVSFILYTLYAPHPIAVNPFKSALFGTYLSEREKAVSVANDGGTSPNEQLVWVLWKILRGDGNDIGPYSPSTLARSPLPPKLRAINLVLDDSLYNTIPDLDDSAYHYFQHKRGQSAPSDTNEFTQIPSRVVSPAYSLERDKQNERQMFAVKLLLHARERVLNLSEQRTLLPLLPEVASSRLVTSIDIAPIVAYNPSIAHPLFVSLVSNPIPENNRPMPFVEVLPYLPPTLPTFDLFGRLLRDPTRITVDTVEGYSTVADLVRIRVLGLFIQQSIHWIEQAERDQMEGKISDDRWEKGLQHLCRFFLSLIKLQIVDPSSDTDCAEICSFCLHYARFEEANTLYRVIMMSGSNY
ncbi:hypothetical protein DFP72DRAFT_911972 [Ephemerocybe angulata]|uniref:CCR4-NOT transcription complex subunit 11 n=1 Tax=Ephemerocybe angulata TaxID=980116 RepID=A0A8H6M0J7_9AGAR|nr:hypothetical protein DFP72DRAFT_911972 [Tulosesus angulatus]